MKIKRSWFLLALLWACVAQAQETPEALRARVVARASAEGVPVGPLERKLAEGQAKGVPVDRVAQVVAGLHDRLRTAVARCGSWHRREDCAVAGADALQVGLPPEALDRVLADPAVGEEEDRLQALFAVSDLHVRGIPAETGLALVEQVRGHGPSAPAELVRGIVAEVEAGGAPTDVARAALDRGPPDRAGNFHAKKGGKDKPGKPEKEPNPGHGRPETPPGQEKPR